MNHIIEKYYNDKIQMSPVVINDISKLCFDKKMLVFGLGYDSELWYNLTNLNTYFVENDMRYINLNSNISANNIIPVNYSNINVGKSFLLTDNEIDTYKIPDELLNVAPFDIILIDGPTGYNNGQPGRLLPIYWSKQFLSKPGTIIYIDDSKRKLESYCINRYFLSNNKEFMNVRDGCVKITM